MRYAHCLLAAITLMVVQGCSQKPTTQTTEPSKESKALVMERLMASDHSQKLVDDANKPPEPIASELLACNKDGQSTYIGNAEGELAYGTMAFGDAKLPRAWWSFQGYGSENYLKLSTPRSIWADRLVICIPSKVAPHVPNKGELKHNGCTMKLSLEAQLHHLQYVVRYYCGQGKEPDVDDKMRMIKHWLSSQNSKGIFRDIVSW